jgi:hypothetical protein
MGQVRPMAAIWLEMELVDCTNIGRFWNMHQYGSIMGRCDRFYALDQFFNY